MDSFTAMPPASAAGHLPAQRIDAAGRTHVDQRAVLALALPLMANSAVQIVLNLTDMWFMGRISTRALAAVGAVQWLVIAVMLVLGGAGTAVQTLVAQYFGARRYRRAGQAVWTALWAMVCTAPLFVLMGAARHLILAPFGFDSRVEQLASAFWFPRVGGAFLAAAVWAMFGFFNGIGRPRVTLAISIVATVTNALLNQLFIFRLGWGIAGSAWATNAAQLVGLLYALAIFMRADYRRRALHGRHRRADRPRRPLGAAVLHRLARQRIGAGGDHRHTAPVARRGLPVLRWPEPGQQHVPARRGRCQDPGGSGAHGVAAAVRAARPCLHVRLRAGLGAFPAAVRLGSRRGVGGGAHLRHAARQHAVPALALRRLAENTALKRTLPHRPSCSSR